MALASASPPRLPLRGQLTVRGTLRPHFQTLAEAAPQPRRSTRSQPLPAPQLWMPSRCRSWSMWASPAPGRWSSGFMAGNSSTSLMFWGSENARMALADGGSPS